MDLASLSLFLVAAVLLVALIVQFLLWVKVRYEHKASIATWEGVISAATEKATRAEEAAAKAAARAEEVHAASVARAAELAAATTEVRLKHEALDESVAALNAKTAARERAAAAEAKRAGKAGRRGAADSEDGETAAGREDDGQGDLLRALAEQAAANGQANGAARRVAGPIRLVRK